MADPTLRDDTAELVAFLRARLDEDERSVTASNGLYYGGPVCGHRHHDPARVLREVEAKRRIVDEQWVARGQSLSDDPRDIGYAKGLIRAVRLLASVYSDHPDYNPGWRP